MKKFHRVWWLCMLPSFLTMALLIYEYYLDPGESRFLIDALICPLVGVLFGAAVVAVLSQTEDKKSSVEITQLEAQTASTGIAKSSSPLTLCSAPRQEPGEEPEQESPALQIEPPSLEAEEAAVLKTLAQVAESASNFSVQPETQTLSSAGKTEYAPLTASGSQQKNLVASAKASSSQTPTIALGPGSSSGVASTVIALGPGGSSGSAAGPSISDSVTKPAIALGSGGSKIAELPDLPNFNTAHEWMNYAEQLYDGQKYDLAIKCFDKVTNLDPKNFDAWYLKSVSLEKKGHKEDALYCLNYCLSLREKSAVALTAKGECLLSLGRPEQALNSFEKSLTQDQIAVRPWLGKGACLALLGKHKEAIICFDKVLTLQPGNEDAAKGKANSEKRIH